MLQQLIGATPQLQSAAAVLAHGSLPPSERRSLVGGTADRGRNGVGSPIIARSVGHCGSRKFNPAEFARWGRTSASSHTMFAIGRLLATSVANLFKSRRRLEAENLFLRHQLNIALRRRLNGRLRITFRLLAFLI